MTQPEHPVYFFGCIGDCGHFLWAPGKRYPITMPLDWPWHYEGILDGTFAPQGNQQLGRALITHHGGWTVLAMWDRSVDRRPDSNGAFIARGDHNFVRMVELAQKHFPAVLARIEAQAPLVEVPS